MTVPDEFLDQDKVDSCLDQSKLSLFFSYVLGFKLGQKTSYQNDKNCNFLSVQHQTFKHSVHLSTTSCKNRKSVKNLRRSLTFSGQFQSSIGSLKETNRKTRVQNISPQEQVHYGYCCDNCFVDPIVGNRYNCQQCDFDICQECYGKCQVESQLRHEHEVTLVQKYSRNPLAISLNPNLSHSQRLHPKLRQKLTKSYNLGSVKG